MFTLHKPSADTPIPTAQLAYVSGKLRNDLHNLVLKAFKTSGLSQAQLAARLGADKAQVSRQLNASGNWTIDTVAKLLFAINGNLVAASEMDPERQETANHIRPDWLHDGQQQGATISVTAAPLTSYTVTRHGHISVGMETSVPTGGRIWYAREEPSARTANH